MTAFLNVESSALGQRWVGPSIEADRAAAVLVRDAGVDWPVARVLAARGVMADAVAGFLAPTLRDLLPDPLTLRDMGVAADRVVAAVRGRQRVAIFGDYDVDGGASCALLVWWLRHFGVTPTVYIPDRIDEGYGPNEPAMAGLAAAHDLIICVDCGTLSHGPVAAAAAADVVILDHHLGGDVLPPALAVVNPNRQDEDGALGHLCAAGVVFLLLVQANRQLAGQGPDLMGLLDLVALATVADVAPLVGVNRAFVRQGLTVMARRARPGLVALADVAGLDRAPTPYHLGFVLGPRINAGGRVGQADLGARLLSTADAAEAARLAAALQDLNRDRQTIEGAVREEALAQAAARGMDGPLVWAAGDGWHPGVLGIVAARLKEAANRPAVVMGVDGGVAKGSARSVAGVDLGAAIHRLEAEGLITRGGGHRMAAGLTLPASGIAAAMARLADLLARQGAGQDGAADLPIDGLLAPAALRIDLVAALEAAGPFGAAAPAPRFAVSGVTVRHARPVGAAHLKVNLASPSGQMIDGIAFNAIGTGLGALLQQVPARPLHLVGQIDINVWQGRQTVQLRIDDAAPASA